MIEEAYCSKEVYAYAKEDIPGIFPELKESEDDRIRKGLIEYFKYCESSGSKTANTIDISDIISWLEKQSNWKPSKDEMGALYGLAYITGKMDDKKDEAITKLYQDLKREFFNGASFENMFPSNSVDSDTNVEKQSEQNPTWSEEDERLRDSCIAHIEEELERIRNDKYGHSEIISDLKESCRERIKWLESLKERIKK